MTKKIEDFVAEFRTALESAERPRPNRRTIQLAERNAKSLDKHLAALSDQGLDVARHHQSLTRVLEDLSSLEPGDRPDLKPLVRKGEALLELGDLIDPSLLAEVEALVQKGRSLTKKRPGSGQGNEPLPFPVAADCKDCKERVVGLRGGVVRWYRVVRMVTNHESKVHGRRFEETSGLKAMRTRFLSGESEGVAGRYRVFKL